MLKSLKIKNFILLKEAVLNFENGFNVLCGETGAGKSIIIKALDSVLGAKISKDVVLNKDLPCYIEATFEGMINSGDEKNFEVSLDEKIISPPKAPYYVDYFCVKSVHFTDNSYWADYLGLISF